MPEITQENVNETIVNQTEIDQPEQTEQRSKFEGKIDENMMRELIHSELPSKL